MTHEGDCQLISSGDREGRGHCPDCDPEQRNPIPLVMHRQCPQRPVVRLTLREEIERDIADDITPQTRTMKQIRQTLDDKCFAGCGHMEGVCTRWGTCGYDRYQAWIEHLLENDCDLE